MQNGRPRVAVLYHYFYPDDVVSARHFATFCQGLCERGWQVEALPCNRGCRDESRVYSLAEDWEGIAIRRVWRPRFRQASTLGRLLNSTWTILAWSVLVSLRRKRRLPDVLVIGTDPIFSVVVAAVVKRLRPGVRIAHWCYDLHPEASIAEGTLREGSLPARLVQRVVGLAYRSCDLLADLGACMGQRLDRYAPGCRRATLVPWALSEPEEALPPDPAVRQSLFGNAALAVLYSGNFGRAHSYQEFLELARCLRGDSVQFCFGVRGNLADELRRAVRPEDSNISFAGFAPEAGLSARLAAADIHLVSLRESWTGVVVPSKFFGSLAAGRPVIFAGSEESAVARWIRQHRVGWVLNRSTVPAVARELRQLAGAESRRQALQQHCHKVYQSYFSRRYMMDCWDQELRALLDTDGGSRLFPGQGWPEAGSQGVRGSSSMIT
jgi:glycosyltransferase involved in cell wall biosynthesis